MATVGGVKAGDGGVKPGGGGEETGLRDIEKLGAFYLGRIEADPPSVDPPKDPAAPPASGDAFLPLLYDSRDLTTHAVCLGMTGSGKTGLCLSLLEEAAIDGIPALAIDPKGDLGNLLLTFPELRPEDFAPWIDTEAARREGLTPEEFAAQTAESWRAGLSASGQDGARIARLRRSAEFTIFTPGGSAGRPLSILRSFAAPPPALRDDADAWRERVLSAVSGLLALLGIEADPLRSREHVLLSNLLENAWRAGRDLDLGGLVREIQSPPIQRVGVLDLESFYPAKDRSELALRVNNLLASPGFAAWMEGEPLDVGRLLFTAEGRPRITILSIAHLQDAERMFFVTLLLGEVLTWMRSQPGTSSLRALLYMDEISGYFPPTANPPSKGPMLTLLKQARAFGLGVVLSTQNPVDLDYKGLSNAGTWFLGRLQTERDKARVLEGLDSASSGAAFDRARVDATLSGLGKRRFLLHSVHREAPVVFQTRWTLCYLRGPMTAAEIRRLREDVPEPRAAHPFGSTASRPESGPVPGPESSSLPAAGPDLRPAHEERPVLSPEILEYFEAVPEGEDPVLGPTLAGRARVHYVSAKAAVDHWETVSLFAPLDTETSSNPWDAAAPAPGDELRKEPPARARFAPLPGPAARPKSYAVWGRGLVDHLYRQRPLVLWSCPALKEVSRAGESEAEFRIRVSHRAREERDRLVEQVRGKYAAKLATLEERVRRGEERVQKEQAQYQQQQLQTAVSVGSALLGALLGGGRTRRLGGAASAVRGAGRARQEKQDIDLAGDALTAAREQYAALEQTLVEETRRIQEAPAAQNPTVEALPIPPRKADILIEEIGLVWRRVG